MTIAKEEIKEIQKNEGLTLSAEEVLSVQEMAENGLIYGLNKSKTHPKMRPYIFTTRSGIEVINLELTIKMLKNASDFLKNVSASQKSILIVGTSPATKVAAKEIAEQTGSLYVTTRWLGGTLTNFKVIGERIKRYNRLVADKEAGVLNKYTKKERVVLDKQMEKMKLLFEGISKMNELPGAILILDLHDNGIAAREAKEVGIPVIALTNTDLNPALVNYPIPCNNRLENGIRWILNYLSPSLVKAVVQPSPKGAGEKVEKNNIPTKETN